MRSHSHVPNTPLWEDASTIALILACVAVLLLIAFVTTTANAQTTVVIPTTTTLWAGTQDFNTFGLASVTSPASGVILQGTAISKFTGQPVRHLWYGDTSNGLCRIDPEVDDPNLVGPAPGIGYHFNVIQTCIGTINKAAFTPGQIAFDAATNTVYTTDIGRTTAGIIRLHYIPTGDSGQGTIDPIHVESLQGTQITRNATGGCPQIADPKTGTKVPIVPDAAAIGPDGNLYVGSIRDGAIIRILSPATFDPNLDSDCKNKIQIPMLSADERFGAGHTFGLGWIGHTLFGADNIAPWILTNADQCLTAANGNRICGAPAVSGAQMGTEILAALIPGPQAGAISDAQFPNFPGNIMYFATFPNLTKVTNILNINNMTVQTQYGGTFPFITGMTADPQDLNNANLYVGSDATQGGINGAGSIWLVTSQAPPPAPPLAPGNASAIAGTSSAKVTWNPTTNGQPITSYNVRTFLAPPTPGLPPSPSGIADVTVGTGVGTAPTTATISGLTNSTSYLFEVQACNNSGCSPFSAPSNAVTPFAVTAPPAPTGVTALAGTFSASVAWTQSSNGGSPITSSTVTGTDTGTAATSTTVVAGAITGATVNGLLGGHTYTFAVFATNAAGSSSPSTPSLPVTIPNTTAADVSLAMSAPASINAGSILTFTMTVTNGGPAPVAQVTLSDTLPASLSSFSTTQGACSGAVGVTAFSCNLGAMAAGSSATINVSVLLPSSITSGSVTNNASVASFDGLGNAVSDSNLINNSASATTAIAAAGGGGGGGGTGVSADIQTKGSAQNGGPTSPATDTITWQIKNATGSTSVSNLVFNSSTASPNMTFTSVSSGQGPCSLTGSQSLTCSAATLAGGQTMTVTVTVNISSAGTAVATGSASFNGTDTQPANNSGTVTINAR